MYVRSSWTIIVAGMLLCLPSIGCAPQYHWYGRGCSCIRYDYCPPTPLPYTTYCGCPTPVASCYALHEPLEVMHTSSATGSGAVIPLDPEGY